MKRYLYTKHLFQLVHPNRVPINVLVISHSIANRHVGREVHWKWDNVRESVSAVTLVILEG